MVFGFAGALMMPENLPDLLLRPATKDDEVFAHDLTYSNMHAYVVRHWGAWNPEIFFRNFATTENFIAWREDERLGLVRLRWLLPTLPTVIVDDLQVLPAEQNKGHGWAMLEAIVDLARERGCRIIRLRVFDENPAQRLYRRFGFRDVEREPGASWLEFGIQPLKRKRQRVKRVKSEE
jgi:GNAT superfamily N-acetyltransferase